MPLFLLKLLPLIIPGANKIISFLKGNWKVVLPAASVILLMTMIWFKNNTIESQEHLIDKYTVWLGDAKKANRTNQLTISTIRAANKYLADAVIVSEEVRATAYREARERERRAAIALDDTKTKLRNLENETPTCAEISRIDIGAACPLSVELLRRAASGNFD